jgi:hypothetical protein
MSSHPSLLLLLLSLFTTLHSFVLLPRPPLISLLRLQIFSQEEENQMLRIQKKLQGIRQRLRNDATRTMTPAERIQVTEDMLVRAAEMSALLKAKESLTLEQADEQLQRARYAVRRARVAMWRRDADWTVESMVRQSVDEEWQRVHEQFQTEPQQQSAPPEELLRAATAQEDRAYQEKEQASANLQQLEQQEQQLKAMRREVDELKQDLFP